LSILLAPIFSDNYNAKAGRISPGNIGPPCVCNLPGPPCYEGDELCSYGQSAIGSDETDSSQTDSAPKGDAASLGLLVFATAYMLRRFFF
jgi:hypothetical protein